MHRRHFFKNSTVAGVSLISIPSLLSAFGPVTDRDKLLFNEPVKPQLLIPRGAVYIPARAFNTWQQWKNYDSKETERDFGYATKINLNALRIWLSYDYWLQDTKHHAECLEDMLRTADKKGIKILLALFDSCGEENTPKTREDHDPKTAVAVKTPSLQISRNPERWSEAGKFVSIVMERFANDKRLLAIEIMNEPTFANGRMAMSRFLFKIAGEKKGIIPLSIGSLPGMQNWGNFMDLGIDILQFHINYPTRLGDFKNSLNMSKQVANVLGRSMWLTEWERLRPSGNGWNESKIPQEELGPDYASLADTVYRADIGNFFWSLMLKPAYLRPQRNIGTFNGLFHEDGSVYSLADARAISGNPHLQVTEKREPPAWLQ